MAKKLIIDSKTGIAHRVDTTQAEDDKKSSDAQAYAQKNTINAAEETSLMGKLKLDKSEIKVLRRLINGT